MLIPENLKGEWLRMSHSVAKRLFFANSVGKKHIWGRDGASPVLFQGETIGYTNTT